ncbi:MAG TPA: Crp/Fnr family transcriptional regulator [Candidatus Saccharimonadales bacterium]|jgi:CRP/FNR family cyclic AMP-dependent transcriptional regulator|nr:Crp/Fnr family transcriptional regulator [Candidatus Saccharimonadales bacterium]
MDVLKRVKQPELIGSCCQSPRAFDIKFSETKDCKSRRVRRGEPVCLSSDSPDSVYYLQHGHVKAVRYSQSGEEVLIDQYQQGSLFGNMCFCEWSLCIEGAEREVVVALEDSTVVVTTFAALKDHIGSNPDALLALLEDFCQRLAIARLRIESLVLHQAEERLARVLFMLAAQKSGSTDPVTLSAAVTHEDLAHLIGVTRPFVTKLIGKLRNRGLIKSLSAGRIAVYRDKISTSLI